MKRIITFILAALAILLMLSACEKEEPVNPNNLPDWAKDGKFIYSDQIGR